MGNERTSTTGTTPVRRRDHALDFIKVVAILLIVFHHYQQDSGAYFDWGINFYHGNFYFGYVVELFFILSGMFMLPYIKRIGDGLTLKRFYLKRALRLLPLVAIAACAYEFMVLIYWHTFHERLFDKTFDLWGIVIDSLGVQDGWVFANPGVNNPTWYVSVLLLCYLVFYLTTTLAHRLKVSPYYLYGAVVLWGIAINTYELDLPFMTYTSGRGYWAFFTGVLLAAAFKARPNLPKPLVGICAFILVTFPALIHFRPDIESLRYLLVFIFYPSLIVIARVPQVNRLFEFKWIETLSKVSFDVYIWHVVCLQAVLYVTRLLSINPHFSSHLTMLAFAAFTFAVGAVSFYCIEQPITKAIKTKAHLLD